MRPEHMFISLESIVRNVLFEGNWGLTWCVVFFLVTEFCFSNWDATEHHWIFMVLITYVVLVYDLAYFTDPYHKGEFDSANRLLLQALPLVVLYLGSGFASMSLSSIKGRGRTSAIEVAP
jgi:hypothetical protein